MGRASNRKRERRVERTTDVRKLRVVVCSYPDRSLGSAAELLKAAIVYADEVLLHSPTAILLASIAGLGNLSPREMLTVLGQAAPALGDAGSSFTDQLQKLESSLGPAGAEAAMKLLLEPTPATRQLLSALDPSAANELDEHTQQLGDARRELDLVVEEQLAEAGVASVLPAIEAGLLKLAPVGATTDLFEAYLDALWALLRDPRCFPRFDDRIADLVDAAVREGTLKPTPKMRSRGRQAGAATGFLARLPTFPLATMDEVVDIRAELDRPLVRFRAEMVNVAGNLGVDAFDPAFDEAAHTETRSPSPARGRRHPRRLSRSAATRAAHADVSSRGGLDRSCKRIPCDTIGVPTCIEVDPVSIALALWLAVPGPAGPSGRMPLTGRDVAPRSGSRPHSVESRRSSAARSLSAGLRMLGLVGAAL